MHVQNREEAQRAKDDLNGIMLHDNDLRIGWGKSIPIPAAPMFVLNVPGGAVPARGAAIGPPGSMGTTIGGPWGHSGPHDPSALSGMCSALPSCLLRSDPFTSVIAGAVPLCMCPVLPMWHWEGVGSTTHYYLEPAPRQAWLAFSHPPMQPAGHNCAHDVLDIQDRVTSTQKLWSYQSPEDQSACTMCQSCVCADCCRSRYRGPVPLRRAHPLHH